MTFGQGEVEETSLPATGATAPFIASFSYDGTVQGAYRFASGSYPAQAKASVYLGEDGYVVAGSYWTSSVFAEGTPMEMRLATEGTDLYVASFAADRSLAWVVKTTPQGNAQAFPYSAVALADGTIVVGGSFSKSISIGPHSLTSTSGDDALLFQIRP